MSRSIGSYRDGVRRRLLARSLIAGLAGSLLVGCSAGISRFDNSYFGLGDGPGDTGSIGERAPLSRAGGEGGYAPPPYTPAPVAGEPVQRQAFQPIRPSAPAAAPLPPADRALSRTAALNDPPPAAAPPSPSLGRPAAGGESIQVGPGDTLYNLSRRHGISVAELKRINGLTSNLIRPGQMLSLSGAAGAQPAAPRRTLAADGERAEVTGDTYTVQAGDSLYVISRRTGVSVADLKSINAITDVRKVMPGTVLSLKAAPTRVAAATEPPRRPAPAPASPPPALAPPADSGAAHGATSHVGQPKGTADVPRVLNSSGPTGASEKRVAAADSRTAVLEPPAAAADATAGPKLRWPARGRIVAAFGPRSDGGHNDGINIAVPLGTDIHAAESGTIAYAGNELKGYGNLVLVRHDNGWVTAYAHADSILVERGARVERGQVIAKAGKTGNLDQPQVRFELRLGAKPVDPTPYLEKL